MKGPDRSLDTRFKGKPVYLAGTMNDFGFVDDVIIHPKSGILAIVSHDSRQGTWAFPYADTQAGNGGIAVAEHSRQSPRSFLRQGRSYQEMIGGTVVGPEGSTIGRIRDIELADSRTGEIAYRVSPPGLAGLWAHFYIHGSQVLAETHGGILVRGGPDPDVEAMGSSHGNADSNAGSRAA